jgi:hypothetical protein
MRKKDRLYVQESLLFKGIDIEEEEGGGANASNIANIKKAPAEVKNLKGKVS